MSSLAEWISGCRVSSVLGRDIKSFGRQHLLDQSAETCWNSEQGTPQYILVEFTRPVCLARLKIQFQGGFAGKDTVLIDADRKQDICALHPKDDNTFQEFDVPAQEQPIGRRRIKILFGSSTDFYGRIIVYRLDILGGTAATNTDYERPGGNGSENKDKDGANDTAPVITIA
ncbi:hypothetical protein GGF46_001871 [Coemansia sp. RSA 552]|nr:hypothetical protein GGF46_001871 [Coemansia sp. RSA 552]